jgi:hypothetical protein
MWNLPGPSCGSVSLSECLWRSISITLAHTKTRWAPWLPGSTLVYSKIACERCSDVPGPSWLSRALLELDLKVVVSESEFSAIRGVGILSGSFGSSDSLGRGFSDGECGTADGGRKNVSGDNGVEPHDECSDGIAKWVVGVGLIVVDEVKRL